jgi:hypothetical protein
VYINNVKQEEGSGKAYTASGTTITFSEAVASGDSCYVVFLGSAIQTVTAPAGSIVSSQFSSADLVLPKTVTIGSAGAEDTKLVFDGNAQDFHIGLDDSADSLTIGLGSTLGTTSHMVFDANGHITKPLQSAFLVFGSGDQNNLAINTTHDVTCFSSEIFDQNADFASSTFTAPVTGRYQLNVKILFISVDVDYTFLNTFLVTSNRSYGYTINSVGFDTDGYVTSTVNQLVDMDAGDTAKVQIEIPNQGQAQTDISAANSYFSGYLVA